MMGEPTPSPQAAHTCDTALDATRPPWQAAHPDTPDTYTLLTRTNRTPPQHRDNLVARVADEGEFRECVAELANGKATGPDEVPNEVLKYLPDRMLAAMHNLFVTMYCAG